MSADTYFEKISAVLANIHSTQEARLRQAGEVMASAIAAGKRVYLFGSSLSAVRKFCGILPPLRSPADVV
jgi:uncharacterized phosphosugar-binding protein